MRHGFSGTMNQSPTPPPVAVPDRPAFATPGALAPAPGLSAFATPVALARAPDRPACAALAAPAPVLAPSAAARSPPIAVGVVSGRAGGPAQSAAVVTRLRPA